MAAAGHDAVALVRARERAADLQTPITLVTSLDQLPASTRLDAIVNLAAVPVNAQASSSTGTAG